MNIRGRKKYSEPFRIHTKRLSEEELAMAGRFLEKGLNLSETARDLFMHRNTLVYHLEKIQKKTGLDVRKFEDAVIFKIALMIERRLG